MRGGAFLKGKEGRVGFRKTLFFYNHFKCLENKLDVIPEAGILYILQIEFNLLLHDYMDVIIYRNHRLGFRSDSLLQSLVIQPLIIASLTSLH